MPHHIAVGIIEADEIVLMVLNGFNDFVGNFGRFHPGTLLKGDQVGRHLDIIL